MKLDINGRLLLAPAAVAAAALALAAAAQAQAPAERGPGDHGPGAHMAEFKAMHEAMEKQHLDDLKTVLRLRPDQEAALQAFIAAHEPHMRMMHMGPGGPDDGPDHMGPPKAMTTPERLDEMAKRDAAMSAEHEKQRQALAKFYGSLSPDQQKVFDALQRLSGHHGDGPGRHMMMMGGPGMMGDHDGPGERRIIIRHQDGGPPPGPPAHEP